MVELEKGATREDARSADGDCPLEGRCTTGRLLAAGDSDRLVTAAPTTIGDSTTLVGIDAGERAGGVSQNPRGASGAGIFRSDDPPPRRRVDA